MRCSIPADDTIDESTVRTFRREVRRVQNHLSSQRARDRKKQEAIAWKKKEKKYVRAITKLQQRVGSLETLLLEETQARERVEAYILTFVK